MVVIVACRRCGRSLLSLVNVVAVGCPSLWLVVDVAGHRYGWSSLRCAIVVTSHRCDLSSNWLVVIVVSRHCGMPLLSLVIIVEVGCLLPSFWLVVDLAIVLVGCRFGHRFGWLSIWPSFWLVVDLADVLVGCLCGCIPNAAPSVNFLVLCVNSALRHYPGRCRGCPAFSLLTNSFGVL